MKNIINYFKNYIFLFIKIFIIIICLSLYINIISSFKLLFSYLKLQSEFIKNEYTFQLSNNYKLKIIKKYKKIANPKISIISPIYNSEKFLLRFLKSIQNQNFIEIEIILIDDFSIDNSIQIIQNFRKQDKRIILLQNKKNKGTFINRNLGVLYSKAKYIILPDPDDILTNNILNFCYKFASKYQSEIIRFNLYIGKGKIDFNNIIKNIKNRIINQPELSTYIYYGSNELQTLDCFITNKFIKKEAYIRALNYFKKIYLNMYITYMEDSMFNYILYRTSKSLLFFKKIGYYYIKNEESITNNLFKISILRMKFIFIYLKIIFENIKNTKYEKDILNFFFSKLYINFNFEKIFKNSFFNTDFYLYYNLIKLFLNSFYFNHENKCLLEKLKFIITKKINIKRI